MFFVWFYIWITVGSSPHPSTSTRIALAPSHPDFAHHKLFLLFLEHAGSSYSSSTRIARSSSSSYFYSYSSDCSSFRSSFMFSFCSPFCLSEGFINRTIVPHLVLLLVLSTPYFAPHQNSILKKQNHILYTTIKKSINQNAFLIKHSQRSSSQRSSCCSS
mgnify:CR=1 FL=1